MYTYIKKLKLIVYIVSIKLTLLNIYIKIIFRLKNLILINS